LEKVQRYTEGQTDLSAIIYFKTKTIHIHSHGMTETREELLQGDSIARGPKLLSIKNYVIEIVT